MTSVSDGASIASTGTRRSFKTKLGSLFATKTGQLSEPVIELEEPWREYTQGDIVKGTVALNVAKAMGITHLTVSLFGYLEVFKHHSRSQPGLRPNPVRVASTKGKRWVAEYYGDGFASLFEQEETLCGGGRLDPGPYHFQFEMQFPPNDQLPSSITFERGTVKYGIAATITRPTTIVPTLTTMKSVNYKQRIDVGKLRIPKPRLVTVEPVATSTRASMVRRLTSTSNGEERSGSRMSNKSRLDSQRKSTASTPVVVDGDARMPASPVPSAPSTISVSSAGHQEPSSPSEPRLSQSSQDGATISQTGGKAKRTITASVELSRAGVLPGDLLPLNINIQHIKPIRSVNGVVVTFFRQARVDMHPNLPVASTQSPDDPKPSPDYYPRSKTGVGGLSLSAAGSSQTWRKDLSQSVCPLYIHDQTLSTVVKPVVRVPEDVFPTMSKAPGDMIAFRYFVEILIDIHGKWVGRPGIPEVGTSEVHSTTSSILNGQPGEVKSQTLSNDPATFYRPLNSRNDIRMQCEVTIGTHDSAKTKSKGKKPASLNLSPRQPDAPTMPGQLNGHGQSLSPNPYANGYDHQYHDPYYYDPRYDEHNYNDNLYDMHSAHHPSHYPPPWTHQQALAPVPPPPNLPDDSQLSEKERMRRAEMTLLPSRPPGAEGAQASSGEAPSAPFLPEETHDGTSAPAYEPRAGAGAPPYVHVQSSDEDTRGRVPTLPRGSLVNHPAPSYSATVAEGSSSAQPTAVASNGDDKQELERRRLQKAASAPTAEETSHHGGLSASASAPSADAFDHEDGLDSNGASLMASAPPAEDVDGSVATTDAYEDGSAIHVDPSRDKHEDGR